MALSRRQASLNRWSKSSEIASKPGDVKVGDRFRPWPKSQIQIDRGNRTLKDPIKWHTKIPMQLDDVLKQYRAFREDWKDIKKGITMYDKEVEKCLASYEGSSLRTLLMVTWHTLNHRASTHIPSMFDWIVVKLQEKTFNLQMKDATDDERYLAEHDTLCLTFSAWVSNTPIVRQPLTYRKVCRRPGPELLSSWCSGFHLFLSRSNSYTYFHLRLSAFVRQLFFCLWAAGKGNISFETVSIRKQPKPVAYPQSHLSICISRLRVVEFVVEVTMTTHHIYYINTGLFARTTILAALQGQNHRNSIRLRIPYMPTYYRHAATLPHRRSLASKKLSMPPKAPLQVIRTCK
ncbi:hypothetical protein V8B97DRAFT_1917789 [Scleroderma yunnanense]